jgi:hypothetical protein
MTAAAEPVGEVPWYHRSPILLSIGAGAIVVSLVVALVVRSGADAGEPAASGSTKGAAATSTPAKGAKGWDLAWVFNDPNRALGDGTDSLDTRTAVWAQETGIVVAGVDNVRGHSLATGAQTWQHQVDRQVCAASANTPVTSKIVVIGEGQDCSALVALNARTGRVAWDVRTDEIFEFQSVAMAKVGVVTLGMHGITIYDAADGRKVRTFDDDLITAKAGSTDRVIADNDLSLSADGSTMVFGGRSVPDGDAPEAAWAFGIDARTGKLKWATQLSTDLRQVVPQAHDGTWMVVGDTDRSEMVHVDAKTGKVRSRFAIPDSQGPLGDAQYERYPFSGPAWYRSGTVFVGGDPIVTYDGVGDIGYQELARVDAKTGKDRWRLKPKDIDPPKAGEPVPYTEMAAGPVLEDGNLLVHVGRLKGSFLAEVDPKTGKVVSTIEEPAAIGTSTMAHQPAIQLVDGGLVFGYNPGGGTNQVDESAEQGKDTVALAYLRGKD